MPIIKAESLSTIQDRAERLEICSRSSSGGSRGSTASTTGPETPVLPNTGIDLSSAVNLLQQYDKSHPLLPPMREANRPQPLSFIPPQHDPLAGPSSSFVSKPEADPATFFTERTAGRPDKRPAFPAGSPLTSPTLPSSSENEFTLDSRSRISPSTSSAPLDGNMAADLDSSPSKRRLASAPYSTRTSPADSTAPVRPVPLRRSHSRHPSRSNSEYGFTGARLGSLNFASLNLSSFDPPAAGSKSGPTSPTEAPHRDVIMTPTTEEYRFFSNADPKPDEDAIEDEDVEPPRRKSLLASSDTSESEIDDEETPVYPHGRADSVGSIEAVGIRHGSFNAGQPPGTPRRRGESVRSTADEEQSSPLSKPQALVDLETTPLPAPRPLSTKGGLSVFAASTSGLRRSPSPSSSPSSRSPSPAPLDSVGPLDPRAYSARSHARSIESFIISEADAGSGAYGLVKQARAKAVDGQPTGSELIIKYIIKQRILADCWKKHKILGAIPVEIHVLDHIRRIPTASFLPGRAPPPDQVTGHANICGMLDFFEDQEHYYMVMPRFGQGEDLFDFVEAAPDGLDGPNMLAIFAQVVDAVAFLHSVGIVHRDIKDENVILDGEGRVQLIDFGSAAYVREGRKFDTFSGTLDFAAPEVLRGERYGGKETDIWALGVLGYVLLCGECPFWNSEEAMLAMAPNTRARTALEAKADASPLAADLLLACLSADAADRPTAREICRHAAFDAVNGWRGPGGWREPFTPRPL